MEAAKNKLTRCEFQFSSVKKPLACTSHHSLQSISEHSVVVRGPMPALGGKCCSVEEAQRLVDLTNVPQGRR